MDTWTPPDEMDGVSRGLMMRVAVCVAGVQSGGRLHGRARTGGARRSGGAADGSSIFFVHRFKSKVGNKLTKNSIKVRIMMPI